MGKFAAGWRIQRRVIGALMLRLAQPSLLGSGTVLCWRVRRQLVVE